MWDTRVCMVDGNPCSFNMQAKVSQTCIVHCVSECISTVVAWKHEAFFFFSLQRLPDFNTAVLLSSDLAKDTCSGFLSLLSKAFGLLDRKHQLLFQLLVALVWWQIKSVKTEKFTKKYIYHQSRDSSSCSSKANISVTFYKSNAKLESLFSFAAGANSPRVTPRKPVFFAHLLNAELLGTVASCEIKKSRTSEEDLG